MKYIEKYANFIAGFFLLLMSGLMIGSVRDEAAIRDEMPHIVAGYSYLTRFDYRLNPEHPPLIKQLAAFPLLFMDVNFPNESEHWKDKVNDQWELGDEFLYRSGNDADKILFAARIPIIILSVVAGLFIYVWSSEIFKSKLAGLLSLILFVFSPSIIAHGRYITTDMGILAISVITLYTWYRFIKKPTIGNFIIASVLQGAMHLSKFSSPLLLPAIWLLAVFAIFVYNRDWDFKKRLKVYLGGAILSSFIAFIIIGGWYAIFIHKMPLEVTHKLISESIYDDQFGGAKIAEKMHFMANIPILRPYAQYFLGFFMVAAHASYGRDTYFLGEVGKNWPHYYYVAYLLKEPIASQLFCLFAIVCFLKMSLDFSRLNKKVRKKVAWEMFQKYNILIIFACLIVGFMYMGMRAKLQLGIRYIIAIFPFLYIIIGGIVAKGYGFNKGVLKKIKGVAIFVLIAWLIVVNFLAYPFYLAYFNEYIGGKDNGWQYLIDSNLDWGQDLRRLENYMNKNGIEHVNIDYFGGGDLDYYLGKERYTKWNYNMEPAQEGWFAISVSVIQWNSANKDDKKSYHWLTDNYEPVAKIGGSIFVYNLK